MIGRQSQVTEHSVANMSSMLLKWRGISEVMIDYEADLLASLRPWSESTLRSKPPRAQGEAASPRPGADSVPPSATRHQQSASLSASPPLGPWLDPGAA